MASKREERQKETHFKVMRLLQDYPLISAREIAHKVGISNGPAYYCVKALFAKDFVKLRNFIKSPSKVKYFYELTPGGVRAKALLTVPFLELNRNEYRNLKFKIERLESELNLKDEDLPEDGRDSI